MDLGSFPSWSRGRETAYICIERKELVGYAPTYLLHQARQEAMIAQTAIAECPRLKLIWAAIFCA